MLQKKIFLTFFCVFLVHFTTPDSTLQAQSQAKIFTKVTSPSTPSAAGGCGWVDQNNDGKLDAYLTFFNIATQLYTNGGDGTFQTVTQGDMIASGNNYSGISWGDYDNNGFPDLYITNMGGGNVLYKNLGDGHFQNAASSGTTGMGGSFLSSNWVDYDNDGNLDLFVTASGTGFTPGNGNLNFLFKNNGDGTFKRVTDNALAAQRTFSSSAAFGDMDNDCDQDVFMTEWGKDNWLFENNGDGTFTKITGATINANTSTSISANWGDYDNDGYLDLFVGNGSTSATVKQKSYLFHNNGDKTFTKITEGDVANNSGCVWTSAWGDVDNDGDLDLYAGTIYDKREQLYLNNGDGTFAATTEFDTAATTAGTGVTGASFGDYDNDGSIDLLVADVRTGNPLLFHNNGNDNHSITISCKGTISNSSAIGTRVKVKATISGKPVWQIREITGVQGFRGSHDLRAHFGLGDATVIDSLVILWPSGIQKVQTNISTDQFISVTEEIPAQYLRASFCADVVKGKGLLTVHFTEQCVVDTNNPVTSWSWDFDNDGTEDSKEQNPSHTYHNDAGGTYSVALTVSNGSTSKTILKKDFITLLSASTPNLALLTKAYSSSNESAAYPAENIIDGDMTTRWASQFSDSQWILVELDSTYFIERVILKWENAYGRQYELHGSYDSTSWYSLHSESKGNGGTDEIVFDPFGAKYLRLTLIKRATAYGFSLYEFEVYRPGTTGLKESKIQEKYFELQPNYPNPFNPETTIRYQLPKQGRVELKVFDLLGNEIETLVEGFQDAGKHEVKMDARKLSSGVYLYRLKTGNFIRTQKMALIK